MKDPEILADIEGLQKPSVDYSPEAVFDLLNSLEEWGKKKNPG